MTRKKDKTQGRPKPSTFDESGPTLPPPPPPSPPSPIEVGGGRAG